jgi:hypothetical protein
MCRSIAQGGRRCTPLAGAREARTVAAAAASEAEVEATKAAAAARAGNVRAAESAARGAYAAFKRADEQHRAAVAATERTRTEKSRAAVERVAVRAHREAERAAKAARSARAVAKGASVTKPGDRSGAPAATRKAAARGLRGVEETSGRVRCRCGDGSLPVYDEDDTLVEQMECPDCGGTGYLNAAA